MDITGPDGVVWFNPKVVCEPDVDTVIAGDQLLPGPIVEPWWEELEGTTELFCMRGDETSPPLVVEVPEIPSFVAGVVVGTFILMVLLRRGF